MDRKDMTFITPGSGNVYADLGLPDAEERQAKAVLAIAIANAIEAKGLTQTQAGELMDEAQSAVSLIVGGHLKSFRLERLMKCARALGFNTRIVLEDVAAPDTKGHLVVSR